MQYFLFSMEPVYATYILKPPPTFVLYTVLVGVIQNRITKKYEKFIVLFFFITTPNCSGYAKCKISFVHHGKSTSEQTLKRTHIPGAITVLKKYNAP